MAEAQEEEVQYVMNCFVRESVGPHCPVHTAAIETKCRWLSNTEVFGAAQSRTDAVQLDQSLCTPVLDFTTSGSSSVVLRGLLRGFLSHPHCLTLLSILFTLSLSPPHPHPSHSLIGM